MRIQEKEAHIIKNAVQNIFGQAAEVFLFGSRADDSKKGGDIDLYIETQTEENIFRKKIDLIRVLYKLLGEQKIDIVINNFTDSLYIHEVARNEGIRL